MDTLDKLFVKNQNVLSKEIEGETIIILENLEMYQLSDSVSSYIWILLNGKNRISDIREKLKEKFNAEPKEIEGDLREFLSELEKKKIIKYLNRKK